MSASWSKVSGPGTVTFADANVVDTTASFSTAGTYVLRLTAYDGALAASDELTIIASGGSGTTITEVRVAASSDDAEEESGSISLSSSDLELVYDGGDQTVGMRFNGVEIPQGAAIVYAYVQFQVDETGSGETSLTIQGQDNDNATTFTYATGDISSRPRTTASVSWSPPPWTTVGEAGLDQRTPDIGAVIQEIVNRSGWSSGNSLAIIITGTGERTAESYNGDQAGAALLHIEYTTDPVNQPPAVTIDAPADGATFTEGESITFSGSGSDAEDGDVTVSLAWVSSLDGAIGNGGSVSRSDLSVGTHTITATATDNDGLTGSDQITITIDEVNTPPTAAITAPADGATFTQGEAITFTGSGNDAEDEDVTASLAWVSDIDGAIGTGGSFVLSDLSVGAHTITATATDSGGLSGEDAIAITIDPTNTPPTAAISAPADGATFTEGESITFTGSGSDTEDGDVTVSLAWVSSLDGEIGTGGAFSRDDLSVGGHTITVTATDSGNLTGSDEITITIVAPSTPPTVAITAPADGATFVEGDSIAFTGSASDAEDGDVTASLAWVSDIDGAIGSGATFSKSNLSAGTHTITATATDSGALTGADQITITVNPNTPPTAAINTPADGATFAEGDSITFTGSASDAEDGDVTASLAWVSDIDGTIGAGGTFTRSDLSAGVHTVTATVTDSGASTGSDEITITIVAPNTPPTVAINTPVSGAIFAQGDDIAFGGIGSDTEDGDLTASLSWVSSLDGAIGSGGTFSRSDPSLGVHTITATATDSGALTGSAKVTITVAPSFNPSDDAMVSSKAPTLNEGSATTLELRAQSKETIQSYLKFAITGLNGTVKSATLRLYAAKSSSSGGAIYLVSNDYAGTSTPWTEDELTWNNAPVLGTTPLSTVAAVAADSWVEFDVTEAISGDGIYSFGLNTDSRNRTSYSSKEATGNHPILVVEIETAP